MRSRSEIKGEELTSVGLQGLAGQLEKEKTLAETKFHAERAAGELLREIEHDSLFSRSEPTQTMS